MDLLSLNRAMLETSCKQFDRMSQLDKVSLQMEDLKNTRQMKEGISSNRTNNNLQHHPKILALNLPSGRIVWRTAKVYVSRWVLRVVENLGLWEDAEDDEKIFEDFFVHGLEILNLIELFLVGE